MSAENRVPTGLEKYNRRVVLSQSQRGDLTQKHFEVVVIRHIFCPRVNRGGMNSSDATASGLP